MREFYDQVSENVIYETQTTVAFRPDGITDMRTLRIVLFTALMSPITATTEQEYSEWWDAWHFGAPCSTKTDIEEGTCDLKVERKPRVIKG